MREIEIKVRVDAMDATLAKLEAAGVTMSKPKEQHDVVYCLPQDKHKEKDPSVNWLRIRTQDNETTYLTLKRSVQGDLDSIEHETIVSDGNELDVMLRYMGYEVYSDIIKVRRTGRVSETIEVCLDEVPPLGVFIELEMLCNDDVDGRSVEAELYQALDTLGIAYAERISHGYDVLMNAHIAAGKV